MKTKRPKLMKAPKPKTARPKVTPEKARAKAAKAYNKQKIDPNVGPYCTTCTDDM